MRPIDADALMSLYDMEVVKKMSNSYVRGFFDVIGDIEDAPTIDPVHAAGGCYCRECEYYTDSPMGRKACRVYYNGRVELIPKTDNDFCSRGIVRVEE